MGLTDRKRIAALPHSKLKQITDILRRIEAAARHAAISVVLLFGVANSFPAHASCLPLPASELWPLDTEAERRPDLAIHLTQARLADQHVRTGMLAAQLFAVLADAYTEKSRLDEAQDAIKSARFALLNIRSADAGRLQLRLDLLDDQLLIANSNSETAVSAISRRLDGLAEDTLERACTLSVRAVAYDYLDQPDRAVRDALDAYRLAKNGNWSNARLEAADTLARKFGSAGLFPQAYRMLDDAIALAKVDNRIALLSSLEYERGIVFVEDHRFADARAALQQSNVYARQVGDRFSVAVTNATLCWALVNVGDLSAADSICSTGDEELAKGNRTDLQTLLAGSRARLNLEHRHPTAAVVELDRILRLDLHKILPRFEPVFHQDRARALVALHRYREAALEFVRMQELEESADLAQRNRQVAVLSSMIASDELAAANRQLQGRMLLQQQETMHQRNLRATWVILSMAGLTISVLLGGLLVLSRRYDSSLRRREVILRSAGVHMPEAFLLLDAQHRVLFANRNLCGHGPVPAAGQPVESALPAGVVPILRAAIGEAFETRAMVTFPAILADSLGNPRNFELHVVPAIDRDIVIGGTLRARDVTEQLHLERQIVDGGAYERQRLSSELHEGLGQQLAGVSLLLGNASTVIRRRLPNIELLIEEIAEFVRQAIDTTRELARGLAPVKIGSGSLLLALERLAADASRRLNIEVTCQCGLAGAELSDVTADHLYRICREAVTNSALHGRCSKAEIFVHVRENQLTMSIRDDGLGFPPRAPESRGMGVKMMAYRARLLGGDLRISTPPEGGTLVLVTAPLDT